MEAHSASSAASVDLEDPGWFRMRNIVLALAGAVLVALALVASLVARTNSAQVDRAFVPEDWTALSNGLHNTNPEMVYWRGAYYLLHAAVGAESAGAPAKLLLWRSPDARTWTHLRDVEAPHGGLLAGRLCVVHDRLFCFLHVDDTAVAHTLVMHTDDAREWTSLERAHDAGLFLGRAKSPDGRTWYAPAWEAHGARVVLLKTRNGQQWETVGTLHEGNGITETDLTFTKDGAMIALAPLPESGGWFGDPEARTLIAMAQPPYTDWMRVSSYVTRLDTPFAFSSGGQAYALGRRHADPPRALNYFGSQLGRKRTALYQVNPEGLTWITDLPSSGDTGYPALAQQADALLVTYVSSPTESDWPWFLGLAWPTDIRIARLNL